MTIRHAELRWQQEKRSRVRTLYAARSGMILRVSEYPMSELYCPMRRCTVSSRSFRSRVACHV